MSRKEEHKVNFYDDEDDGRGIWDEYIGERGGGNDDKS